jgi:hypothetical protein
MVVACVLAFAATPLIVAPAVPTYQAEALVVARVLVEDVRVLPRLGAAVFTAGAVEERVSADPALSLGTGELIPDRLSLLAAEDSVVLVVQGRDPDPATSARLANLGAAALVDELNRGGAGVGEFTLQAPASVPGAPLGTTDPPLRAALGALAGAVLGVALVALVAAVRRPVVTAHDVEGAVGVPLLGRLRLSGKSSGPYPERLEARGVVTVARWLARVPAGRLLMISPRSAVGLRQRVYVLVAIALQRVRPVLLEAHPELIDATSQHAISQHATGRHTQHGPAAGELVLVDGGSSVEIVDPATTRLSVVVVVPRGIPRRRLRAVAADFMGGELIGVILVEGGAGLRRTVTRPAPAPASAPAGRRQHAMAAPSPETT